MNKTLKIYLKLNLILFIVFLLMDAYELIFLYNDISGRLTYIASCEPILRINHYIFSLLIIIGSYRILVKNKPGIWLLLLPCIGFIAYDISMLLSFQFSLWLMPCCMSFFEQFQIIYIYSFIQVTYIMANRKSLSKTPIKLYWSLGLLILFILYFILINYLNFRNQICC